MNTALKPLLALFVLISQLPASPSEEAPSVPEKDRAAIEASLQAAAGKLESAAGAMKKTSKQLKT